MIENHIDTERGKVYYWLSDSWNETKKKPLFSYTV